MVLSFADGSVVGGAAIVSMNIEGVADARGDVVSRGEVTLLAVRSEDRGRGYCALLLRAIDTSVFSWPFMLR